MAIIDLQNTFAETLDLGAAAAGSTTAATNVYDFGSTVGRDLGVNKAEQVWFELTCMESFDEAMAGASLTIQIVTSAAAALTSPKIHWTSGALDTTLVSATHPLILGNRMVIPFPAGGGLNPSILRYLGLTFVVAAQALSAGKFDISMGRGYHKDRTFTFGWAF
jgi:hypothetical protein